MSHELEIIEPETFLVFGASCSCGTEKPPDFCRESVWFYPCWARKCYYLVLEPVEGASVFLPEGD